MVAKRKKGKSRTVKKVIVKTAASKAIKKQLKSISKKLAKSKVQSARTGKKLKAAVAETAKAGVSLKAGLKKLSEYIKKAKRKKSRKQLNEYNLFMRRQLIAGKTFNQAAKLWKQLRRVEHGKLPVKTRVKSKIVIKKVRVKSKPVIKYRTKYKTKYKTRTRIVEKPVIKTIKRTVGKKRTVSKTVKVPTWDHSTLEKIADRIADQTAGKLQQRMPVEEYISEKTKYLEKDETALDEIAYRIVKLYFEELARIGFKRQMSLEDLVRAFVHTCKRMETKYGQRIEKIHYEDMAYRLVNLYFIELTHTGHKRALNLDESLDMYFYTVEHLKRELPR